MTDLSIGVLGPLDIVVGGRRLQPGTRQARLLALLALNANRPMTPTQVIDALWADDPPATARSQVHNAVARLRRALGDARTAVVTDGTSYRLDLDDDQADFLRFSRLLSDARGHVACGERRDAITSVRAALRLWRGSAFDGLDGEVFEHAVTALDEDRLDAWELLIQLRLDEGDRTGLVAELTTLTAKHPAREKFVCQLMIALYREGRQSEALRTFERARARLADELGVDPGPELTRVHEQILRDDPALGGPGAAPAEPHFLPHDVADFTGRTDEVRKLVDVVDSDAGTAVMITALDGMPGVGKTTLAVRVGHLLADRFPDGRLFVDLHGFTPGHEPLASTVALDLLLRAAGVAPERIPDGLDHRANLWRSTVAGRRMLVVLDNAVDAAQVRPLLPGTPGVRVVVTSRRNLTMLEGASSVPVDLFPHADAVELFTRVATPDRVAGQDDRVDEVVTLCGFLPLAIRIAAARLRSRPQWTVDHLAGLLRDEEHRVAELAAGDRSVYAAFTVSYRNLPQDVRRSFRLLGLVPGGDFDTYTAAAVTGSTVLRAGHVVDALVDANLLVEHKPGRYHFHDLLRQYARAIADEAERGPAADRVIAHFLALGRQAERLADPGRLAKPADDRPATVPDLRSAAHANEVVGAEHRNVLAVLDLAARHADPSRAADLADVFGPLLLRHGHLDEALACYETGLGAAVTRERRAALHRSLGLALITARRLDDAVRSLRASLAIEEELGNDPGAGRVHANIGIVHIRAGRFADALAALRRGLDLIGDAGTPRDRAAILVNLSVANIRLGRYAEAIAANREVLAANAELDNAYVEATSLLNLGIAQCRAGLPGEALDSLTRSRAVSEEIGATEMTARSLYTLADCHRRLGDLATALACGRSALVLARDIGDVDVQNNALVSVGYVHLDLGDLDTAADCFRDSLRRTEHNGDNHTEVLAQDGLARIAGLRGVGSGRSRS